MRHSCAWLQLFLSVRLFLIETASGESVVLCRQPEFLISVNVLTSTPFTVQVVTQILPELTYRKGSFDRVDSNFIFCVEKLMATKIVSKLRKERYQDQLDTIQIAG